MAAEEKDGKPDSDQEELEALLAEVGDADTRPTEKGEEREEEAGAPADIWQKAEQAALSSNSRSRLRSQRVRPGKDEEEKIQAQVKAEDLQGIEGELAEQLERNESIGIVLGAKGRGWIEVEVAEDNMQAWLRALDFGGDPDLDRDAVLKCLQEDYDICSGIDAELVGTVVERAAGGEMVREDVLVAQAKPPTPGDPGRIDYCFAKELEGENALPFWELYTAFEKTSLEEVLANCSKARLVVPGEKLAVAIPPTQGEPGTNVRGDSFAQPGKAAELEVGDHVSSEEDGYYAQIMGYACVIRGKLAVLPPIWVAPDKMEAYFVFFPPDEARPVPQSDWVSLLLELREVRHGIDESSIDRLCTAFPARTPHAELLARGTPVVHGTDTHIRYTFDPDKKPGTFQPDGSINLRERNVIISVDKGQLLGELVRASEGQDGVNVKGDIIRAEQGEKKTFRNGGNVRIEEEDGTPKFFAQIAGSVKIQDDTLRVEPIQVVDGDVNYDTGNIDVPIDIHIKGSVLSGFSVKSRGNVVVEGVVENGGQIRAQGDVQVSGGIVGDKARVVTQGSLETKLIQNAAVLAQGDVRVGGYIYNGSVRAGGKITVHDSKHKRGGSIVGGQAHASGGIEAKILGSPTTDRTLVGLRETPQAEFHLRQFQEKIAKCDETILRILRTLGLKEVNAALLKRCIREAPVPRRKQIAELIKLLQAAVNKKTLLQEELQALHEQVTETLTGVEIRAGEIFPDVLVQIGDKSANTPQKLARQAFYLDAEEGIRWRSF